MKIRGCWVAILIMGSGFVTRAHAAPSPEDVSVPMVASNSNVSKSDDGRPASTGSGENSANESAAVAPKTPAHSESSLAGTAEQDIPLHLDAGVKAAGASASPVTKGLLAIIILGAFAGVSYFLVGKYKRATISRNTAPEIKILRQHYLAPKKSLAIIRVAGESILIGVTDQNINLIKSLALLDEDVPEEIPGKDFESSLEKASASDENFQNATPKDSYFRSSPATNRTPPARGGYAKNSKAPERPDLEGDEYSITGIKDFVNNRLKNMRSLN